MDSHTPSSLMYEDLRKNAGLSNRDAARILLSNRPIFAGRTPRDRITERTFLSREVVHVLPDNVNGMMFGDFSQSAQTITGRLASKLGGGEAAYGRLIERYSGETAQRMAEVLDAYGREGQIYLNAVRRVQSAQLRRDNDRAVLLVMAFVAVGCLADPRAAAAQVEAFTRQRLATDLVTIETDAASRGATSSANDGVTALGLVRVVDGAIKPPIHALSLDPRGTIVGSLPTEGDCITDVEVDVSRQHLHVWHDEDGWWCEGMGSTNGTALIDAATKQTVPVELPRSLRGKRGSETVKLHQGDVLCLGSSTQFLVIKVSG